MAHKILSEVILVGLFNAQVQTIDISFKYKEENDPSNRLASFYMKCNFHKVHNINNKWLNTSIYEIQFTQEMEIIHWNSCEWRMTKKKIMKNRIHTAHNKSENGMNQ